MTVASLRHDRRAPALSQPDAFSLLKLRQDHAGDVPWLFFFSALSIPAFYGVGLLARPDSAFTSADLWRFWVVHLWVEDFLELFTTINAIRELVPTICLKIRLAACLSLKQSSSTNLRPLETEDFLRSPRQRYVSFWQSFPESHMGGCDLRRLTGQSLGTQTEVALY